MEAIILAGGLGSRLGEETINKPKPMVEIGGFPILFHIMSHLNLYGVKKFIIALGYKGFVIKDYFQNILRNNSNLKINLKNGETIFMNPNLLDWEVSLIDTGQNTMTGGRLRRLIQYVEGDEFLLTYGDGVTDLNVLKLIQFHKTAGTLATVTAVQPKPRFGVLTLNGIMVSDFQEKPSDDKLWYNGGYFILNKKVAKYLESDTTVWEAQPLENLAKDNELSAYKHHGFWQAMDTQRDKEYLESLVATGHIPWRKLN